MELSLPNFDSTPQAIAVDLDGTLLNNEAALSSRGRLALEACLDRDIPVIIATARAPRTVRTILGNELFGRCFGVGTNGALAWGKESLSSAMKEVIKPETASAVMELIANLEPEAFMFAETDGDHFAITKPQTQEQLWYLGAATPNMVIPLGQAIERGVTKIGVVNGGSSLINMARRLEGEFKEDVSVIISNAGIFLDIVKKGVSKAKALRLLLESAGIPLASVLAFGDDLPDMEMLTICGMSVAVSNAAPEVKAIAKYNTASNDEDGVAMVLERMLNTHLL